MDQEPGQPSQDSAIGGAEAAGPPLSRRNALKTFGAGVVALGMGGFLEACSSSSKSSGPTGSTSATSATTASSATSAAGGGGTGNTIRIGYVSPKTGALADFSQSDPFILNKVRATSAYNGLKIGNNTYSIQIVEVDSQSDPNRAAQVAQQLINQNHVDLIVTSSAPETTNPVATACEQLQTPCLSTVVPWEAWYGGLGGNPGSPTKTFTYNTMFFFGMKEFAGTFLPMWDRVQSSTGAAKVFAGMFPNDTDGNAFRAGFPPYAEQKGYRLIDGGGYTDGSSDYSSMIAKFKSSGAEFFVNAPLPPDFNTFWKQASQRGFRPKLATVAKVLLFPADVVALGTLVNNIATDAWWTPFGPYKSSLSGESARQFALDYQNQTGNQWVQSLGSAYSLFEIAIEALKAVTDPHDKAALADALHKVSYDGMCGPLDFASGPAPGVGIIKPVGIQWKKGTGTLGKPYQFEAFVVDNSLNPSVPLNGSLTPTFS